MRRFLRSRFVRDVKFLVAVALLNPMSWWIYPNIWSNFLRPVLSTLFA